MNRLIILYDKDGKEIGRHISVYTNPRKDGDPFLNEAVYYYYQLNTVARIAIVYQYEEPSDYE